MRAVGFRTFRKIGNKSFQLEGSPMQIGDADEPNVASVLIIDDDDAVRSMLTVALRMAGFLVLTAADGEAGLTAAIRAHPDVLIVDLFLPAKHGLDVISELRARGIREHIIAISGVEPDRYAVTAIEAGADAWLTKPVDIDVVEAHVRSGLRRAREYASTAPMTAGDLTFDPITGDARRGARRFSLSSTERTLIAFCIRHSGQALSVEELWSVAWPRRDDGSPSVLLEREIHAVEVAMSRLAAKINGPGEARMLTTTSDARRRRIGYLFVVPSTTSLEIDQTDTGRQPGSHYP
jgi:DNA-binding response OmpR family regulator